MDTFEISLKEALRVGGREILRERNRLSAYLADLAPDKKREVRIFSKSCSASMLRMFDEADGGDGEMKMRTVYKARHMLMEEEGLSEKWAEKIVRALAYAFGWDCENGTEENGSGRAVCGIVVAAGYNGYGQCNVSEWEGITAVACGYYHTVGLKKDSTAVAAGDNSYGQCNVSEWKGITAVACELFGTAGLKKDGTVVAVI